MNSLFNTFILILVIVNTVLLAMERYPEPSQSELDLQRNANYFFTFVFFVEICMKILAIEVKDFVSDKMILLDSFIVIMSVVELVMEAGSSG